MHNTWALVWAVAAALVMMSVEWARPGTTLPQVRGWWLRVIAIDVFQVSLTVLAGFTWNRWLQEHSWMHAARWPSGVAVGITYFISTFVYYWWHRVRHESPFWWRAAHQIHHSASRLEVLTSFYKHPLEIVLNTLLSALICYPLMGCSSTQGAAYTFVIALAEMFYHWNVHTPRWIGVLLQRPESHRLHHRRFHHTKNYGDLPLWDWLFGTYSNPRQADRVVCGFGEEAEGAFGAMLLTRPVETKVCHQTAFQV